MHILYVTMCCYILYLLSKCNLFTWNKLVIPFLIFASAIVSFLSNNRFSTFPFSHITKNGLLLMSSRIEECGRNSSGDGDFLERTCNFGDSICKMKYYLEHEYVMLKSMSEK